MALDALTTFLDGYMRDNLATQIPAIVLSVDEYEDKQFVSVKPAISRLMETGQVVSNDEIVIHDVPVILPSGGGAVLSFPIKVGNTVWLQFSQRNLEDWVYSDGQAEVIPGDSRHFSMTDAVAFPCIYTALSNLKPSGSNVELKWDNKKISLKPSGEIEITNGSAVVKLNPSGTITANGCTITTGGNVITANGTDLDAFYQDYLAHRHSGVTTGGGNTGTKV
jgi:hypothetical protein